MNGPISHLDQLESVRTEWNEVHTDSRLKSPFLTLEYLQLWYSSFADPDQVRIYRAVNRGRTIGFLPLVVKSKGPFRLLSSLTNDHCLHSEPLVKAGCEERFPEAILKALLNDADSWDLLQYEFSNSYSATPGLIPDELLDRSGLSYHRESQPTFLVRVDRPFDDYLRSDLSPKFRKNIKMYRKRLQKAGDSQTQHLTGADALDSWPVFVRIEGSGWKGRERSSIDSLEANFQSYYQGLVRQLSEQDALHLYYLVVHDEPIAAACCYREGDVLHYAKIGYLEKHRALSPSNLLLLDIIKNVREDCPEVKTVNLFPWGGGYKHRFANVEATYAETVLYGRSARGRLVRLMHGTKNVVRRTPGMLPAVKLLRRLVGKTQ